MSQANHDDLDTIECLLREYFNRHPQAADTVEGIREWWLPDDHRRCSLPLLEAALRRMLKSGEITSVTNVSGDAIYAKRLRYIGPEY